MAATVPFEVLQNRSPDQIKEALGFAHKLFEENNYNRSAYFLPLTDEIFQEMCEQCLGYLLGNRAASTDTKNFYVCLMACVLNDTGEFSHENIFKISIYDKTCLINFMNEFPKENILQDILDRKMSELQEQPERLAQMMLEHAKMMERQASNV